MFISLKDFDQFLADPKVKFKEEEVFGQSLTIISYMIADKEFWILDKALETRGHCFDTLTGQCLALTFPKFFNIGEREETLPHNLPWNSKYVVTSKIDGSMIIPVLIQDNIVFKTKKSFYSDVAIYANEMASENVKECSKMLLERNLTPIFEFTSPKNKIVLDYGKDPKFTLLAVRDMKNGIFIGREYLEFIGKEYQIDVTPKFEKSKDELFADVQTLKNFEGYVIQFESGMFVKLKTIWYNENHRIHTELRERDVAEMVVNETLDDCKSIVHLSGLDISLIEKIEERVVHELNEMRTEVERVVDKTLTMNVKEIAIEYKKHFLFSLIMKAVREQEPDYVEFWKRNFLRHYSLDCVYNSNF